MIIDTSTTYATNADARTAGLNTGDIVKYPTELTIGSGSVLKGLLVTVLPEGEEWGTL